MNEEATNKAAEEALTYEISDEALETAAGTEALAIWTNICTGVSCPG